MEFVRFKKKFLLLAVCILIGWGSSAYAASPAFPEPAQSSAVHSVAADATLAQATGPKCASNEEPVGPICVPKTSGSGAAGKSTIKDLVLLVINSLLIFAGVIAVVFIILGGFWYITSGGNEETAEKGKKALINAVLGLVVVIMAYAIVNIVARTLTTDSPLGSYLEDHLHSVA